MMLSVFEGRSSQWRDRRRQPPLALRSLERAGVALSMAFMFAAALEAALWPAMPAPQERDAPAAGTAADARSSGDTQPNEMLLAFYLAQPYYYRSTLDIKRPDGTDARFSNMGWDGDMLMPPIDGGVRGVKWHGNTGWMIDYLHNKAIARLGKGAHGRKVQGWPVENAEVSGTWKGQPAKSGIPLTEYFTRLEFTHGQNMLFFTPLLRLGELRPGLRPYVGVGAGIGLPHVEMWTPGEEKDRRTSEYQLMGPTLQFVAGLELRTGKASWFLEYKVSTAFITAALTGNESWMNFNVAGDLMRQASAWWKGEQPKYGRLDTRLSAHQVIIGGGYWWNRGAKPAAP